VCLTATFGLALFCSWFVQPHGKPYSFIIKHNRDTDSLCSLSRRPPTRWQSISRPALDERRGKGLISLQ
jgi:hypothetical protein